MLQFLFFVHVHFLFFKLLVSLDLCGLFVCLGGGGASICFSILSVEVP